MTLKEFLDTLEKCNIDFGDLSFEYEDSKTERMYYQLLDSDSYDVFVFDLLENHLDEIDYLYSSVDGDFIITIDRDSVEKVIKNYQYNITLD